MLTSPACFSRGSPPPPPSPLRPPPKKGQKQKPGGAPGMMGVHHSWMGTPPCGRVSPLRNTRISLLPPLPPPLPHTRVSFFLEPRTAWGSPQNSKRPGADLVLRRAAAGGERHGGAEPGGFRKPGRAGKLGETEAWIFSLALGASSLVWFGSGLVLLVLVWFGSVWLVCLLPTDGYVFFFNSRTRNFWRSTKSLVFLV